MQTVEKVSVSLSNELLRAVRSAVHSGEYASASEVVREALREWKQRRPTMPPRVGTGATVLSESVGQGELQRLAERFRVRQLAVFGSALRAEFSDGSDIDLAVEFDHDEKLDTVDQYFGLKAALENLLGRKVDLVELSAMPASRLKREIERTRIALYDQAR